MQDKISVTKKTIEYLRQSIMSDKVRIGDKLATEHEICEKLEVGRGTVREAFRNLEAQGYLEIKPGRGAFVARKSIDDNEAILSWFSKNRMRLADLIEVRCLIEPGAAALAAERMTSEMIEELEEVHGEFTECVPTHNYEKMAMLDGRFHEIIIEMTGNQMLILYSRQIADKIRDFRLQTFKISHNAKNAVMAHSKILSAIKEGDSEVASVYMKRHIDLINEDMEHIII